MMQNRNLLIYPLIFAAVLVPVMIAALVTFQPGADCDDCDCATLPAVAAHTHGAGIARSVQDNMQLILNVSNAAALYQVVDGTLEICGGAVEGNMKHITVDVNDARLALGERLPVDVTLTVRAANTGAVVVEAGMPAMYAQSHGYHFGDNFLLPNDATYDWTVTISPVQVLRQEGAKNLWTEPVTWSGTFTVDAEGNVIGKAGSVQPIGDAIDEGLHIMLGYQGGQPLYEPGAAEPATLAANSRYFVVDVTDHTVNYEEKLPGATVALHFESGDTSFSVPLEPVISPEYGFHYGANVPLTAGEWQITVEVTELNFWRHAGSAVNLARNPVRATFTLKLE